MERDTKMWKIKKFKDRKAQNRWIYDNEHRYKIVVLFVNNGFAVEYKKLLVLG